MRCFALIVSLLCSGWASAAPLSDTPDDALQKPISEALAKVSPSVVSLWYGNPESHVTATIIGGDGLIVTCGHLKRKVGETVEVRSAGRKPVVATVVSKHKTIDLALVKVTEKVDWPAVPLGDSKSLTIADPLLAIGYPHTYLFGVFPNDPILYVRLAYRREPRLWPNPDELQTTAQSRPGDSGGPLFDLSGSLVGVLSNDDADLRTRYVSAEAIRREWKEFAGSLPQPPSILKRPVLKTTVNEACHAAIAALRPSVAEVRSEDRWSSAAVYVGNELFLTKASELGAKPRLVLDDGFIVDAVVAARDSARDLALLKVPNPDLMRGLVAALWDNGPPLLRGTVIAATPPRDFVPLIGVVSVTERAVPGIRGLLPVTVQDTEKGIVVTSMLVSRTTPWLRPPSFPLQEGDSITAMAGQPIRTAAEFNSHKSRNAKVLGSHQLVAGEAVLLEWNRDGAAKSAWVNLRQAESSPTQSLRPYSYRCSGFSKVFASDFAARPEHAGSPVVSSDGRVIGLLIAKAPYLESLILPASEITASLESMMKSVKK